MSTIKQILKDINRSVFFLLLFFVLAGIYQRYNFIESEIMELFYSQENAQIFETIPELEINKWTYNDKLFLPIVRISIMDGKEKIGFCSGSVITNDIVLTAAHCVTTTTQYGYLIDTKDVVISDNNRKKTIKGKVIAIDKTSDIALVKGNFKDFNKIRISFSSDFIFNELYSGIQMTQYGPQNLTQIKICGYPRMSDITCYSAGFIDVYNDYYRLGGPIYHGMSGGPTLVNGVQVGINSSEIEGKALISPVFPIKEYLSLKIK